MIVVSTFRVINSHLRYSSQMSSKVNESFYHVFFLVVRLLSNIQIDSDRQKERH